MGESIAHLILNIAGFIRWGVGILVLSFWVWLIGIIILNWGGR